MPKTFNGEISLRFLPPIPDGYRILENEVEVAGINYRTANALAFAKRRQQRIELERDPSNPHDPNAIKVIGVCKGWFFWRRYHIGYLPRDTAARIVSEGIRVEPRLRNIWAGGYVRDAIHIRLDLVAPKPEKTPKRAKR